MSIPNSPAFIKRAVDALLGPEELRLEEQLQLIIDENAKLQPDSPCHGFAYNGGFYDRPFLPMGKRIRIPLHSDLWPKMEEHIRIKDQIATDRRLISQMMGPLIMSCYSLQDVRDALPEVLTDLLEEFATLSRTRLEGYTLLDKPLLAKQFEKLKDRIHFYIALRLLL